MLPSKSCKTINVNFLLKNFGLTFFDRFKTGTYLVNWFGRGSVVRPNLAEPPSSADTDADSSVVHYVWLWFIFRSTGKISEPQQPSQQPLKPPKEIFIHIDLKGARPQLQFWINFCRLLRDWGGVHGLILEWEDSYPLEVLGMYHQEWVYSRYFYCRFNKWHSYLIKVSKHK